MLKVRLLTLYTLKCEVKKEQIYHTSQNSTLHKFSELILVLFMYVCFYIKHFNLPNAPRYRTEQLHSKENAICNFFLDNLYIFVASSKAQSLQPNSSCNFTKRAGGTTVLLMRTNKYQNNRRREIRKTTRVTTQKTTL